MARVGGGVVGRNPIPNSGERMRNYQRKLERERKRGREIEGEEERGDGRRSIVSRRIIWLVFSSSRFLLFLCFFPFSLSLSLSSSLVFTLKEMDIELAVHETS